MSLHHLSYLVSKAGSTAEAVCADYGYDLTVFTFDPAGRYENGNIYVQLKATDTLRRDTSTGAPRFRLSRRDLLTWESEPFPVYLVLFDAIGERAYSLYLQRYLQAKRLTAITMKAASLDVLLDALPLDATALTGWRSSKEAVMTRMGSIDHG